jgi:hypothetical protein
MNSNQNVEWLGNVPKKLFGKWNSARKRIVNDIGNMEIRHLGIGEYVGVLGGIGVIKKSLKQVFNDLHRCPSP